ncbi:DUF2147 domain-containing protein [Cytophagaceae bacterium DM2B3-1]|uniref:DUF2147 domain-containing protein n=1 Tax=Xanthocytophaga flava TaxID=3048013 RepID=A0ABT7CP54_9BACT|nr:DUF2147 domain-containing protein [Xanthocytophaga flavus]MDJ1466319.1 DUF2147 domain-containing protein [Xanthocytophaga flavus]MDJ1495524.1 DUF2147 domain-containing protein [Xanthocytophaga flavus]
MKAIHFLSFLFLSLCTVLSNTASVQTANGDAIIGIYQNQDGDRKMEIYKQDNQYFGKLIWLKTQDGKAKAGDVVLKNLSYSSNQWKGKVYAPARNTDFPATIVMPDANTLQITAKAGFMSRSKDWKRVTSTN